MRSPLTAETAVILQLKIAVFPIEKLKTRPQMAPRRLRSKNFSRHIKFKVLGAPKRLVKRN